MVVIFTKYMATVAKIREVGRHLGSSCPIEATVVWMEKAWAHSHAVVSMCEKTAGPKV